jgi:hypothetical protein
VAPRVLMAKAALVAPLAVVPGYVLHSRDLLVVMGFGVLVCSTG